MSEPALGVVVVTFNSADVILDCLESLLNSTGVRLAVAVVDNASTDGTPALVRDWAAGRHAYADPGDLPFDLSPAAKPLPLAGASDAPLADTGHRITLLETGVNGGFAAGVNHGLAHLATDPGLDRFWVLNPDGVPAPETARNFATAPGGFSLMGGRVLYLDGQGNNSIQVDGGKMRRTGVSATVNKFLPHPGTPMPEAGDLDFITGASMVASRTFYEAAGPMPEDYFLYYEEVDWASRRGDLPLACVDDAVVWHRAGTSIGSGSPGQGASPMSHYFLHRGRMRFVRRVCPQNLPFAFAYTCYRLLRLLPKRSWAEFDALARGGLGLPPPRAVRERLSPEAQDRAFGRRG